MELVRQFEHLWNSTDSAPDVGAFVKQHTSSDSAEILDVLLLDQQQRWRTEQPIRVERYLALLPDLPGDLDWKLQLAIGEFQARRDTASPLSEQEISSRFPDLSDTLRERIRQLASDVPGDAPATPAIPDSLLQTELQLKGNASSTVTYITSTAIGVGQKGRYRLDRVLGEGGFGRVYLGYDEELQRQVAIKVPTKERFQKPEDAEAYLAEARTVASLDHSHIVPVFDVGRTQDGSIYVVSKYIEGSTLEDRIKSGPMPERDVAQLLSTAAVALQHAHDRRLVHRDIKPANILIEDSTNTPYVADFGLAIREEDYLRETAVAGTPAYMSPEQARSEGHRLDGRSDMFSLGVIMYELLTGKKPFRGSSPLETLQQVISAVPRPPRELVDTVPAELERICLKTLSKRASDRYATATEFAADLQEWLNPTVTASQPKAAVTVVPRGLRSFGADDADFFLDLLPGARNRDGLPESIAFWKQRIEQTDPEKTFTVGLIYGPSGCGKSSLVKAGLLPHVSPDVITVYVEATPGETEIRILRGLKKHLPDLPEDLGLVETLTFLRRQNTNPNTSPKRKRVTPPTESQTSATSTPSVNPPKIVIIIDQFEQWLHAHRGESDTKLIHALGQCDGGSVQAIVMVRDDFAMAASRFMKALDTRILEGHNFATVDLFDVEHAVNVLIKFGQAFGKLPAQLAQVTEAQREFANTVANGLAVDGKVVSVRLALFAEMVKNKPWTPETLQQVGGTHGVGVNFLQETFSGRDANPDHRLHAAAARGVLKSLLPELGSDIKGHMQSHVELQEAAGYTDRASDFADLLRILDAELRLITPTDPEGRESSSKSDSGTQYYQLTHDYLVPSLREWLTRKQQETWKGRAELKLAERSALWAAKPENRNLPSLSEWLRIRLLTPSKNWTPAQKNMMKRATRVHSLRSALSLAGVIAFVVVGLVIRDQVNQQQEVTKIRGLVNQLVSADPNQVPAIIEQLDRTPETAATFLTPLVSLAPTTPDEKRSQLHARLAQVSRDPSLVQPLTEELLTNKVSWLGPIRHQLRPYATELTGTFREILHNENSESQRRFRAALALASYVPESDTASWTEKTLQFVADQLVASNAEFQPVLREYLSPISVRLLPDLERIFGDAAATDGQRLSAANAFADYASTDISTLTRLLTVATPDQYGVLLPIVAKAEHPSTVPDLTRIVEAQPDDEMGTVERIPFGQRRANAAVTLLQLNERENVLPVFELTDDPEALTQFIFRCRERGVRVDALLNCLRLVDDGPADRWPENSRYALLLSLGEYSLHDIPESRREALLEQLGDWYRNDPSSGVHGATGWLLRQWGQHDVVRAVDQTPVAWSPEREWFTLAITVTPTSPEKDDDQTGGESGDSETEDKGDPEPSQDDTDTDTDGDGDGDGDGETDHKTGSEELPAKTFYYTFIVFPEGEFEIGSPLDEPERGKDEVRHSVTLTRPFAMLDREITFEELIAFSPSYTGFMQQFDAASRDAGFGAHWYDSVGFCRWLSQQSGLSESEQCYVDPEDLDEEQYPREPNPAANWAPRNWPLELGRRGFRLPTESEWEAASRAGTRTAYGYGSDMALLGQFGWFQENSGRHVHPPRELRPTIRGVFDLHGNLFEWTHDSYGGYSESVVVDPLGVKGGSSRVFRGGGWDLGAADCRVAYRGTLDPARRTNGSGFRLALSSPSGQVPEAGEASARRKRGGSPRPEMPEPVVGVQGATPPALAKNDLRSED
jgi:eukaryotic-like serine/threonine-protein kinase